MTPKHFRNFFLTLIPVFLSVIPLIGQKATIQNIQGLLDFAKTQSSEKQIWELQLLQEESALRESKTELLPKLRRSSKLILPPRFAMLETVTTRVTGDLGNIGSSWAVKAKWPKWFVPNCNSKPSAVSSRFGGVITPALFIKKLIASPFEIIFEAKALIEDRSARSNFSRLTFCLRINLLHPRY